jgi:hypothetical protein
MRITTVLLLLLFANSANANAMFSAFLTPYMVSFFPPLLLAVVIIETAVCYKVGKTETASKAFGYILLANIVSTVIGAPLAGLFPTGLVPVDGVMRYGSDYEMYSYWGILLGWFVSVLSEAPVYKIIGRYAALTSPYKVALIGNTATHICTALLIFFW